jgi:hypothetical protein
MVLLRKGETLAASVELRASAEEIYAVISDVVEAVPGQRFSFVVQVLGGDWTQWTYHIEPGTTAETTRLTEAFKMCVALPFAVALFERLALFVWDRRTDLQKNLEISVDRIRSIVEAGVKA